MTFGLTSDGFVIKTLTDIKQQLEQQLRDRFGDIDTDPEGPIGQLIGIFSEVHASNWELAQQIYHSQYRNGAEGLSLDFVVALTGITRQPSTPSLATVTLFGDEGTVIPVGTRFRQSVLGIEFDSLSTKTIDLNECSRCQISNDESSGTTFEITVNSQVASYTSLPGDTASVISNALKTQIDGFGLELTTDVISGVLQITANDGNNPINVIPDATNITNSELVIELVGTPVNCQATVNGSNTVPIETIDTIVTPVANLDSVLNLQVGQPGNDIESDADLRIRQQQTLARAGAATVPAMEARLLEEVPGVSSVAINENREDVTVGILTPHSFQVVIVGGDSQAIREKIWEIKPAGIETIGSVVGDIIDSQGNPQTIRFDRPQDKFVHLNVEFTLYSEEIFPTNGVDTITQALVDYINALGPGNDLIIQRYIPVIYGAVPGVENITLLEHDITDNIGDPPTFVTTNIPIAANEVAVGDISIVSVTQV